MPRKLNLRKRNRSLTPKADEQFVVEWYNAGYSIMTSKVHSDTRYRWFKGCRKLRMTWGQIRSRITGGLTIN